MDMIWIFIIAIFIIHLIIGIVFGGITLAILMLMKYNRKRPAIILAAVLGWPYFVWLAYKNSKRDKK